MTRRASDQTRMLATLVVDPVRPEQYLKPWRDLCDAAVDPNPFFAPDFLTPFLEQMGQGRVDLCVVFRKDTGAWVMAAPVGRRRLGLAVPATTSWATEYSPLGIPLLHAAAPSGTVDAFLELCVQTVGCPLAAFPYLPLDTVTAKALKTSASWSSREVREEHRASHDAGSEGEMQFSEAFSGKRRKELPRQVRRLAEQGEVRLESFRGDDIPQVFEIFLQLEASGWKGKNETAMLNIPAAAEFARKMIVARAQNDGVRVDCFSLNGKPIALLIVLVEKNRAFSWKIAFDEDYARYSPGAQVTLYALERNLGDKTLDGGDSLAVPGHKMIEPLWRGRLRYATLLSSSSATGRVMRMAAHLDLSVEQDLRRVARKLLKR